MRGCVRVASMLIIGYKPRNIHKWNSTISQQIAEYHKIEITTQAGVRVGSTHVCFLRELSIE